MFVRQGRDVAEGGDARICGAGGGDGILNRFGDGDQLAVAHQLLLVV